MSVQPKPLLDPVLVLHFENALKQAFSTQDSISLVTRSLVQALQQSNIRRWDVREAYEALDI